MEEGREYEVEISARRRFIVEARDKDEAQNIVLEDELNLHRLLENLEYYVEEIE